MRIAALDLSMLSPAKLTQLHSTIARLGEQIESERMQATSARIHVKHIPSVHKHLSPPWSVSFDAHVAPQPILNTASRPEAHVKHALNSQFHFTQQSHAFGVSNEPAHDATSRHATSARIRATHVCSTFTSVPVP